MEALALRSPPWLKKFFFAGSAIVLRRLPGEVKAANRRVSNSHSTLSTGTSNLVSILLVVVAGLSFCSPFVSGFSVKASEGPVKGNSESSCLA